MSKVVHLLHGAFNRNASGWSGLEAELAASGYQPMVHGYGWVGPLTTRFRSYRAAKGLIQDVEDGDHVIAFSNGCLVAWEALEAGARFGSVVLIQPALDRRAGFAQGAERITVLYNRKDCAVQLARLWRWISPLSWAWRHGWGAMGRYGTQTDDPRVYSIDTERENDTTGHTQWRKHGGYWYPRLVQILRDG